MRNWITLVESMSDFPAELATAQDIAEYIEEMSSDYVDVEMIAEHYFGCRAVLKRVPLHELSEGPPDANVRDLRKEARYAKMEGTIPPIVVEDGVVMDGNHRYRVALAKGLPELLCYVIEEIPDED